MVPRRARNTTVHGASAKQRRADEKDYESLQNDQLGRTSTNVSPGRSGIGERQLVPTQCLRDAVLSTPRHVRCPL